MLSCFKWRKSGQPPDSYPATHIKNDAALDLKEERESLGTQRRHWLQLDNSGEINLLEANPRAAALELGLPERDVLLVDPQEGLRLPVKLGVRDSAILICLEGLRLIVTKEQALIVSLPAANALQQALTPFSDNLFVQDLTSRLRISSFPDRSVDFVDKSLPFSLIVLEWALATAVRILAEEAVEFERMAIPVLDQIATRVSSKRINNLRRVKYGASDLTNRVDRFRQELRSAMDDEVDLLRMNLSHRSSHSEASTDGGDADAAGLLPVPTRRRRSYTSTSGRGRRRERRRAGQRPAIVDPGAVAECTSLLECYVIQVEAALNSLRNVSSYSGSTEDVVRLSMKMQRVRLGHY